MIKLRAEWLPMLEVAEALSGIEIKPVFAGGLVAGVLVTDPGAPSLRTTDDIDLIVEALTVLDYHKLAARLRTANFKEDHESSVICRWKYKNYAVDVMPTNGEVFGMRSRWFPEAYLAGRQVTFEGGRMVWTVTAPYFLALKIEAFLDRGQGDFSASHDMEDLIAVIDGRDELRDEVRMASQDLREYLAEQFAAFLTNPEFIDALPGHLAGDEERQPIVEGRLQYLATQS